MDSNEVKLHFLDYWRVVRIRWGLIALVFLLVVVSAAVTVTFLPKEFLAKVSMEVRPDEQKSVTVGGSNQTRYYDPQFVATQFAILRKTSILYPVIDNLGLIKIYSADGPTKSKQEVYNILLNQLDIQEVRNTSIIEVGVYNTDRELAANIANYIAVVYANKRLEDLQKVLDRGLSQFQDEIENLRKNLLDAAKDAARIRQRDGINDPDPESQNASLQLPTVMNVPENAVVEQRLQVAKIRTGLQTIEQLKPTELINVLKDLEIDDPTVTVNLPELQKTTVMEADMLNSGLGENHPRIKALRARKAALNRILADALETIRRTRATKLQFEEQKLASMEANLATSKTDAIGRGNAAGPYIDAKSLYLQAKNILQAAELRFSTQKSDTKISIDPVIIRQRAEPPIAYARPVIRNYMILAVAIGLLVGVALAFFVEYLDTSVKTLDDLERFMQLPVLAVIPRGIPMLIKIPGEHPDIEAYRILRANMEFNKPSPDAKTMTMISAGPGEGKSTTLNNLAFTCAKGGYNVLVVDADLRRPAQHVFFDTDNAPGLADYLQGKASVDSITRTTKIDNLSFIPSGQMPEETTGLLSGPLIKQLLNQVRGQYDLVFFDSPPILGVSDGSVLASVADMVGIVVQHRRFPRAMLQRVKQAVQQVGGHIVGVVLNNVDAKHDDGYSSYNAYQDYYAPRRGETRRPAPVAPVAPPTRRPGAPPVSVPDRRDNGAEY